MSENETQDRKECFLQELKDLLKKHKADVYAADGRSFDTLCVHLYPAHDKDACDFDINVRDLPYA